MFTFSATLYDIVVRIVESLVLCMKLQLLRRHKLTFVKTGSERIQAVSSDSRSLERSYRTPFGIRRRIKNVLSHQIQLSGKESNPALAQTTGGFTNN